ncbi:hypothetical protein GCM10010245_36270 [Streptomyces spectabilis]|uniref:SRSO17 transposase n=1 Tax=Streptomyces spectabilis TaxID=68270 RepID=A0A7W8AY41_STRST|nr:SRSO17 transposase [Streptomyces spectabilis]GGV21518.1 hypothetical protein GCM10010245_36270 [Streptomyces spectabilis]
MRGLVAPLERKNGWTLAEEAAHAGPDRLHRPPNRIEWDADEVLEDVRGYVVENLGDEEAMLVVDDTGFLKKGTGSAGVQRQYSGTAGRTENSQNGVGFATKAALAKAMVPRAITDRSPFGWMTADAAYGFSKDGRFELEQADVFHVMATTRHDTVVTRWAIDHPVHDLSRPDTAEVEAPLAWRRRPRPTR